MDPVRNSPGAGKSRARGWGRGQHTILNTFVFFPVAVFLVAVGTWKAVSVRTVWPFLSRPAPAVSYCRQKLTRRRGADEQVSTPIPGEEDKRKSSPSPGDQRLISSYSRAECGLVFQFLGFHRTLMVCAHVPPSLPSHSFSSLDLQKS